MARFYRAWLVCFALIAHQLIVLPPIAQASDLRTIDVASIEWPGSTEPRFSIQNVALAIENEVAPSWKEFTSSRGATGEKTIIFQLGIVAASKLKLPTTMSCEGANFANFVKKVREDFYSSEGISNWQERYLVIVSPEAGCVWSGRATVGSYDSKGGGLVLHNTSSGFVITHEIGHLLGLGHSNLLQCENGAKDGPWGRSCKAIEYGGSIDVMGNVATTSPLSTYHQWRMGLLEPSEVKQSWLNESVDLNASDLFGGTRAIFIRDGKSTYWIEYRRPRAGTAYNAGLVVYRTDPPSPNFIDSPNPEDRLGIEPGIGVSTDFWMLNLDNYVYSPTGRTSGSMTLTPNRSLTFYSGEITIEAVPTNNDQKITVKISHKADILAPSVPVVTSPSTWNYPGIEIIETGYDDADSAIAGFEALIDDKVVSIPGNSNPNVMPTYLDPLGSRRTIYLKDLPEGNYSLSIRAIDVWGNKSLWSPAKKVTIDRGLPTVKNEASVIAISNDSLKISLSALKDTGSGLCSTQLVNEDGFVLQSSTKQTAPEFTLKKSAELKSSIQIFDCLGNGVTGDFFARSSYLPASKSSRTGKWISASSTQGEGALTCITKCSASFTISGRASILVAEGEANVLVSGKSAAKITLSNSKQLRTGATVEIGGSKRVLRVTGSRFTLIGVANLNLEITNLREEARIPAVTDPSLTDPIQKNMSKYGFNEDDFSHEWAVLPMARGTTLDDPTLDLCSATYKSETGRQFRRQVTVSKVGAPYLFLSNEVVKYKDNKSAEAALNELQTNYEACLKNKGGVERDGTFVDYTFSALPNSDVTLVAENSRVLVRAQIGKGVSARQLLAFYQFKGEMFTGLYVVTSGDKPINDAEAKRWFDVASVLAQRLNQNF